MMRCDWWLNTQKSKPQELIEWGPLRFLGHYTPSCVSCFALIILILFNLHFHKVTSPHHYLFPITLHNKHHFFLPPLFSSVSEMKSSLSSTSCERFMSLFFLLFLLFFSSANCKVPPSSTSSGNTLNHDHHHHHHHHHFLRYCESFTKRNPRSLCTELQSIHQRLIEAIPPSQENGIDPRFGAEKRLVPSGPNPLHNWLYWFHHH